MEQVRRPRYCYPQCRDPWFQECAECWRSGGNPALYSPPLPPTPRRSWLVRFIVAAFGRLDGSGPAL